MLIYVNTFKYYNIYIYKILKKNLKHTMSIKKKLFRCIVLLFVNTRRFFVLKVFFLYIRHQRKKNLYKNKTKSKCYHYSVINKKKDSRKFLNRNYLSINYIEREYWCVKRKRRYLKKKKK